MFNFMPTANIHPVTGIRYGAINGNSLDPDVLYELHDKASEIVFNAYRLDEMKRFANERDHDYADDIQADDLFNSLTDAFGEEFDDFIYAVDENYEYDEPQAEFEHEGIKVVFSYLGGAPLVIVTESPCIAIAELCSPCVPNAGNLDSKDPDGEECYDVPVDWYAKD